MKKPPLHSLTKANRKLSEFCQNLQTEQLKAGAVQAFEYTFELAWKSMKSILEKKGLSPQSPRDTFRFAAATGLISSPDLWFKFLELRNLSVHTYNDENLEKVVGVLSEFVEETTKLIQKIGSES